MTAAIVVLAAALVSAAPIATTTVPATASRSCRAFLFARADAKRLPIVVELIGSGVATTSSPERVAPVTWPLVEQGRVALVTFDAPGIAVDQSGTLRIDDAIYNASTPADLEVCMTNALRWASPQPIIDDDAPIVLHGHSEGAVIAVRSMVRLEKETASLAKRVRLLLLDGTPAGSFREIEGAQLGVLGRVQQTIAFAFDDDAFFRSHTGMGAATMRALLDLPPLTETFVELAELAPDLRVVLVHGRNDALVPLHYVEELERTNRARHEAGRSSLQISLRIVDAGHALDDATVLDMRRTISDGLW